MAYNANLATRIASHLQHQGIGFVEKKMFGGMAFMIEDKMCVGVMKNELMLRVLEDAYQPLLRQPFARMMDFNKRPMNGFLFIEEAGLQDDKQLAQWIAYGLDFAKKGVVKSKKNKKEKTINSKLHTS